MYRGMRPHRCAGHEGREAGARRAPASRSKECQPAAMAKTPMSPWLSDGGRVTLATVFPLVIGMVWAKTYVFTLSFPVE